MKKNIYDLELHEIESLKEFSPPGSGNDSSIVIIRVPGGWIYHTERSKRMGEEISITSSSVFVPFNEEFNNSNYFKK